MKNNVRRPQGKPDISFSTPNDHKFPTPQEFEESMKKRGHFWVDKPKLSAAQIVLSVFCILGICAALFFAVRYFLTLQPDAETSDKYGSFAAKLMHRHDSLQSDLASGDQSLILSSVGIWAGLGLLGLLAGTADLLISRIPVNNQITYRFGFGINPLMRFLPALATDVYMLFRYIATKFDSSLDFTVTMQTFHIKGEGYTWAMWVTQGLYILLFLACIFMIYETFANSGIFGMIIRLPLAVISNGAVIMLLLLNPVFVIVITIVFILIKAVGIILRITVPDHARFYRE